MPAEGTEGTDERGPGPGTAVTILAGLVLLGYVVFRHAMRPKSG